MKSKDVCEICGKFLNYVTDSKNYKELDCFFCGQNFNANIFCPDDHFICDDCHAQKAVEIIKKVCLTTDIKDPYILADKIMLHPSFSLYGPEHHTLTAAVLVTCLKTNNYKNLKDDLVGNNDISEAINRASKIPGGHCGFYGCCGSAMGAGVAISIFTNATPSTNIPRSIANTTTSRALNEIADNLEHCCKRSTKLSIKIGVEILREKFDVNLAPIYGRCIFSSINPKCARDECPIY